MTIARKIELGFVCLIVLSVACSLYLLQYVQRMGEQSRRLVEVHYRAGTAALRLNNQLLEIEEFTRKVFAVSEPGLYATALKEQVAGFSREVGRVLELDLSGEDREAFKRLQQRGNRFQERLADHLRSAGAGDRVPEELAALLDGLFSESRTVLETTEASQDRAVEASRETSRRARWVPWIFAVLALVAASALSLGIVRSITGPIRDLVAANQRLASGDFSTRVEQVGSGEVGELSRNFNVMARKLQELDQMKRDFVSHVSHDLKAPLASIQETTSLLLEETPGSLSEKQRRLLQLNLNCSGRLSAMINNLLDLSKLEAGVARYEFQRVDFVSLVNEVVAEVEPLAGERGCDIRSCFEADTAMVRCDAGRIMQVIRNLLDNAVNFSPSGAPIEVRVRSLPHLPDTLPDARRPAASWDDGAYLLAQVSDRGPGIAGAHKEKVFEKFHQVKQGGKIHGQGVGLGLAICKSIVEAHGGSIWVENNSSEGSCFCLLLPVSGPPTEIPAPSFSTV